MPNRIPNDADSVVYTNLNRREHSGATDTSRSREIRDSIYPQKTMSQLRAKKTKTTCQKQCRKSPIKMMIEMFLPCKIPGHALHEKGLQRQKGVGPLVSSQRERALAVPVIKRLSTAVNRRSTAGQPVILFLRRFT